MAILPELEELSKEWTDTQRRAYVSIHWLLIIFYAVLILITLANIWQILIKQERWKTLPLLVFYIFVFIAVLLRELCNLMGLDYVFLFFIQPIAKQGVGIIQSWMMFELGLKLRQGIILEKNIQADTTSTNKLISYGQLSTIIFIFAYLIGSVAFVFYMISSAP